MAGSLPVRPECAGAPNRPGPAVPAGALGLILVLLAFSGCAIRPRQAGPEQRGIDQLVRQSLPGPQEGLPPLAGMPAGSRRGWEHLREGQFLLAEKPLRQAVEEARKAGDQSGLSLAWAGLGYSLLGQGRQAAAEGAFQSALEEDRDAGPALVGLALLQRFAGRSAEALQLLERLTALYPGSAQLQLELEQLRLQRVDSLLNQGQQALTAGECRRAIDFLSTALGILPGRASLHALLAEAHQACGDIPSAFTSLEQALRLASAEEASGLREKLAWLELEQGDPGRAAALLRQLLAERPADSALADGLRRAEALWEERSLPPQYRQALARPSINRGDLAAILAVELGWSSGGAAGGGKVRVITDVAGHWAGSYIATVAARGVMEVYQNHTFRPAEPVTRGDLADVACRILGSRRPAGGSEGGARGGGAAASDLPREHRHYACVRRLLDLGLMTPYEDGTFRISGAVSGEQARQLILALRHLSGPADQDRRSGK